MPNEITDSAEAEAFDRASREIAVAKALGKTRLYLAIHELRELPRSIGELTYLQELDIQSCNLTELPPEIANLKDLKFLRVATTPLKMLPKEIKNLTELREIQLLENELEALPDEITKLSKLVRFWVAGNKVSFVPESIGNLSSLQELNLRRNPLTFLPDQIRKLVSLQSLLLDGCLFSELPNDICGLESLRWLGLAGNKLSKLPESIGSLSRLEVLDLNHNHLLTLPPSICKLGSLRKLFLHSNEDLRIPPDVLGPSWDEVEYKGRQPASPGQILDFYFSKKKANVAPLNEIKLTLVGRGGSGKTATVNQLLRQEFIPGTDETIGIDIADWHLPCPGGDPVRVHVWDFAGQTLLHGLHQFFLSSRSVYVLVLAGRDDLAHEDAEHWLRIISAFGTHRAEDGTETAPQVIVTLNKWETERGESRPRVDQELLREKFPGIRAFVETDCKTGYGIKRLKKELAEAVAAEKWVREGYPKPWFQVKERLAAAWTKEGKDYLPYEQYQAICSESGITEPQRQAGLARVLHYLGLALNYGDDERLKDTTVLNPHWVTGNIYKLMREAPRDSDAVMTLEHVAGVLPKESPEMRAYLVELMRRFDLAFPLPEKTQHWLVPQRLPAHQPQLPEAFREKGATRLRFSYSALPAGMLPKFITRTHILSDDLPETRWVNGVVLQLQYAQALVKADHAERTISVSVIGPEDQRPPLMSLAQRELRSLNEEIRGLNPREEMEVKSGIWVDVPALEKVEDFQPEISVLAGGDVVLVRPREELNHLSPSASRDPAAWKPKLFISYAHRDERMKDELVMRLKLLQAQGLVNCWHDRMIEVGEEWDRHIMRELESADIVLMLVTSASLASDYIRTKEMENALQRRSRGEVEVFPVILEHCQWQLTPLKDLQALPEDAKPVRDWKPQRNGWYNVMEGLRRKIEVMKDVRIF